MSHEIQMVMFSITRLADLISVDIDEIHEHRTSLLGVMRLEDTWCAALRLLLQRSMLGHATGADIRHL